MIDQGDDQSGHDAGAAPSATVRWVAGFAGATVLGVGVILYYTTGVCNEQVTQVGTVVTVCRNLQVTDPPVIAIGLAMLLAMTAFFSEITGFGFSLKRDVRRANKKADTAITKAAGAENAAHSARQTSQLAEDLTLTVASSHVEHGFPDASAARAQLDQLISQYNTIRAQESSGPRRTSHMTMVVSRMISVLNRVALGEFDVEAHLSRSDDNGHRLAGYAFLYANPDPRFAPALVQATVADRTPFGQYWALRALRRLISLDPSVLDFNSRNEIEELLARLRPNTDRAYELRQVLAAAE